MNQSFATFNAGLCLMAGNSQFFRMFRLTPITAKEASLEELLTKKLALKLKDPDIIERLIDAGKTIIHNRLRNSIMVDLADERFMEFIFQPTPQGFSVLVEDVTQPPRVGITHRAHGSAGRPHWVVEPQLLPRKTGNRRRAQPKRFDAFRGHASTSTVSSKSTNRSVIRSAMNCSSGWRKDCAKWPRREDVVARLGGDEFAILQPGDRESAGQFAARVVEMLSEPYRINGAKLSIGASVGVAMMPDDGVNAGELMKSRRHGALYRQGRGARRPALL